MGVGRTVGVGVDVGSAAHAAASKTRNNARPKMDMALWLLCIMYLQIKFPARSYHHCEHRFAVPARQEVNALPPVEVHPAFQHESHMRFSEVAFYLLGGKEFLLVQQ